MRYVWRRFNGEKRGFTDHRSKTHAIVTNK
jgi:hypothetical protein